jgi:hypothetical protein
MTMAARKIRFIMGALPVSQDTKNQDIKPRNCLPRQQADWITEFWCDQVPKVDFPGKV